MPVTRLRILGTPKPKLGGTLALVLAHAHGGLIQPQAKLVATAEQAGSLVLAAAAAGRAATGFNPIIAMPRRQAAICMRTRCAAFACA